MAVPECFHDLFESQADATPDALALVCDDVQWTYAELEKRANRVARLLHARGIGPGKFVGLYLKRSEMSVVAILATLKSGAAYVPLDPGFPPMRIQHILDEAQISLIIADPKHAALATQSFDLPCIVCDTENPDIVGQSDDRLTKDTTGVTPDDLCYVLYTSGTTGRPKGVMTEHRNVTFFAESFNEVTQLRSTDRIYHGFALGFDGSIEELCMAWTNGACLVVGVGEVAQMGNEAARLFTDRGVTVFSTVPTCLRMLQDEVDSLRLVIVSGEPCPPELVSRWARPNRRMLNVYGPTETTVNTTVKELVPEAPVTIGRPLRGYQTLILSPDMQPVPPGNSGELYIGGRGLARGYLSQPELTAKQFVPNPLHANGNGNGQRYANGHSDGVQTLTTNGCNGSKDHLRVTSHSAVNGNGHSPANGNGATKRNGKAATNGKTPSLDDRPTNGVALGNGRANGLSARLYRTGDLVQLNDDGELLFLGRIDQQVKIRGYRIELSEIEEVLREHPSIEHAVVKVHEKDGRKELAAFVVVQTTGVPLDRDHVVQWLRDRTPIYMVPAYLDEIEALPTLASGKVDRSRLPEPQNPLVPTSREIVDPETPEEANIAAVWKSLLKVDQASVEDDFFMDLGGYSLLAAELVSKLRQEHGYDLSIRDVYSYPTIRKMAKHVADMSGAPVDADGAAPQPKRLTSREAFESVGRLTRWTVVCLQAISMALMYGVRMLPLLGGIVMTVLLLQGRLGLGAYIWSVTGLMLFGPLLGIVLAIAIKWAVIGRYKAGEYPVWSFYYFRWWLASRVQFLAWTDLYAGTPILSLYYRLMGAKVGHGCIFDTTNCVAFDLLTVGDDTCVGAETQIFGYLVEDGMLRLGAIEIGKRCYIGIQSALGLNSRMGDDAYLDDLSLLPENGVIETGEAMRGSPAAKFEVNRPPISEKRTQSRHPFIWGVLHFIASEFVGEAFLLASGLPMLIAVGAASFYGGLLWGVAALYLALPVSLIVFCVMIAGLKVTILPRSNVGTFPVESFGYLRHWSADLLMRLAAEYVYSLYTTIFLPTWLRMLGAKIGKRAEISTVIQITPDLVEIGDESFFADGSIVGGRRLYRGHFVLKPNRVGSRSFIGNSSVLPGGANVGDNCLLGVLSYPPSTTSGVGMGDGDEWLGSPAFRLPYRRKVDSFDAASTFKPTLRLYVLRYIIDAARVVLPFYNWMTLHLLYAMAVVIGMAHLPIWAVVALSPFVATALAIASAMFTVAIKEALMGSFKPAIVPLWCTYVWVNELVNGVYETTCKSIITPLLGTPFISWFLRLLGCRIGKHCFIETELFSEFDLVHVGDYVSLNAGTVVQNHLFEDRVMKSSHLHIGDECSVGNMTVVLYDTVMERGSRIAPLSLLMKGETLPEDTSWIGIPTSQEA